MYSVPVFLALASVSAQALATSRGLNLPSQHADTNQGNFLPGVFTYKTYDPRQIQIAKFNALRLGVNVATSNNPAILATLRGYTEAFEAISDAPTLVCMWDTLKKGETGHGDGKVAVRALVVLSMRGCIDCVYAHR